MTPSPQTKPLRPGHPPQRNEEEVLTVEDPLGRDEFVRPYSDEHTRSFLARSLLIGSAVGLLATTVWGLYITDWKPLQAMWKLVGLIVAALTGYYFRRYNDRSPRKYNAQRERKTE